MREKLPQKWPGCLMVSNPPGDTSALPWGVQYREFTFNLLEKNMKYLFILFALLLAACGDKVSVSTLEQQKQIAIDNSLFNAQEFRAKDPRLVNYKIISAPDSSQLPECPQGDGWATLELINTDSNDKEKIKCSTYSKATGCFYDRDFFLVLLS